MSTMQLKQRLVYPQFVNPHERIDLLFYSEDGSMLVGGGSSALCPIFAVWDTRTGELIRTFTTEFAISSVRMFAVVGNKLLLNTQEQGQSKLRVFDLIEQCWERVHYSWASEAYTPSLLLESDRVYTLQSEGLMVFDRTSGECLERSALAGFDGNPSNGFALARNAELMVYGEYQSSTAFVLDRRGKVLHKLDTRGLHDGLGAHVYITPDGTEVITGATRYGSMVIERWDARTGQLLGTIERQKKGTIVSIHRSPDNRFLVVRTAGIDIHCYELSTGKLLWEKLAVRLYGAVAFARDGQSLAVSIRNRVHFVQLKTGEFIQPHKQGWNGPALNLHYSPKQSRLFVLDEDQVIAVNTKKKQQTTLFVEPENQTPQMLEHPSRGVLIVGSNALVSVDENTLTEARITDGEFGIVAVSEEYLATTDAYGTNRPKGFCLWTIATKTSRLISKKTSECPELLCFTPKADQLICAKGKRIWTVDTTSLKTVSDCKGLVTGAEALAVSDDGTILAVLGKSRLQLWSLPALSELSSVKLPKDVFYIAFKVDQLILCAREGSIWSLATKSSKLAIVPIASQLTSGPTWESCHLAVDGSLWVSRSDCAVECWQM